MGLKKPANNFNFIPGNTVIFNHASENSTNANSSTYLKKLKWTGVPSKVRIKFDLATLSQGQQVLAQIYINNQPKGFQRASTTNGYVTYTEDFDLDTNDEIALAVWRTGASNAWVRNLQICVDPANFVIQTQ